MIPHIDLCQRISIRSILRGVKAFSGFWDLALFMSGFWDLPILILGFWDLCLFNLGFWDLKLAGIWDLLIFKTGFWDSMLLTSGFWDLILTGIWDLIVLEWDFGICVSSTRIPLSRRRFAEFPHGRDHCGSRKQKEVIEGQ